MPYVGNIPAESYAAFNVQYFTTSATDTYTLDRAVANELDIRLVINNVIQEPGSGKAYTAAGTTLTLSTATTGSDTMYCVYIGKAVQTVNPGAGSVGTTALADNAVTEAKLNVSNSPTNGYVLSAQSGAAGGLTWAVDAGGAALTGSTNNTITTVTGANAIQGEANLTFDGTDLTLGTGNIVFGTASKGVYLGVTAATASNLLDYYEEGSFTPTWITSGGNLSPSGSVTPASTSGTYTKIGDLVTVQFITGLFSVTGTSGSYQITNMPFTTNSAQPAVGTVREYGQTGHLGYCYMNGNSTTAVVYGTPSAGQVNNPYFYGCITYKV